MDSITETKHGSSDLSAGITVGRTELIEYALQKVRRRWLRVGVLVFKVYRLPLEGPELVK
jgi:hypothetical protein